MTAALRSFALAARNNAWSNDTFYGAIAKMDVGTFTALRPGFFASLSRTLNHIYEVDLYLLDALEEGGMGRSVFGHVDVPQPAALHALQQRADARLIAFCDRLDDVTLTQLRTMERKDTTAQETVIDLLLQLFQHQIHHRGQAHVQLSHAGIDPPQLDEFYLACMRPPSAQKFYGD